MNDQIVHVLFVLFVVLFSALRTDSCCHFRHLDSCNVFQKGGNSVCNRSIVSGNDADNISELDFLGSDFVSDKNIIKLHNSTWFTDECVLCNGCSVLPQYCYEWGYPLDNFLFLNLSFSLGWQNVTQVIFEVIELSENTVFGQKTYHIIDIENVVGDDAKFDERDIYYIPINFLWKPDSHEILTMLPGVSYKIFVYLPEQRHNILVDSINVEAPDCFQLIEGQSTDNFPFFCNSLTSISYWMSDISVNDTGNTAVATFRIDTEAKKFANYTISLLNFENHDLVLSHTLENKEEYKKLFSGKYYVMDYTFYHIPEGSYVVSVQANVNSSLCEDEPYWGHRPCRIAYSKNFTVDRIPTKEPLNGSTVGSDNDTIQPPLQPSIKPDFPEGLSLVVVLVIVFSAVIFCLLLVIFIFICLKRMCEHRKCEDGGDFRTVRPDDSICGLDYKTLETPGNDNVRRLLNDPLYWISADTETSAGDPTPSDVFSLDDTTVTDSCEYAAHRQRQLPWKQPLLIPLEMQKTNLRQANGYHPVTQDVSSLDQNRNEIENGDIT